MIYYRKNDFKEGRETIIFVHGLSGSSSAWLPYEKIFGDKYNTLVFDLRGHGKSEKPRRYQDYTIEKSADDLYGVLNFLKIKNFILISHSFGVLIALQFLQKHSDIVSKTVFLSPHYNVGSMWHARIFKFFLTPFIKLLSIIPFYPKLGTHVDYSKYPNTGDWNLRRMLADVGNTTIRVYLYCTLQSYEFDGEEIVKNLKIPSLIVSGKKDTIFPTKYAISMSKMLPNSKLVLIKNTDHIVVLNNVREVSDAISEFLG